MRPMKKRHEAQNGFGLIDVMFAMAILFSGAVLMITVLPQIINASQTRTTRDNAYIYATSQIDYMLAMPYSSIAASSSGDFSTLLGTATDADKYSWNYTSQEIISGLYKKVTLGVSWDGGTDTYVFYVADLRND